jgi:putative FmdB family regulatory protein
MPLYEYKCNNCSNIIEKIQKFDDEPLTICPTCCKTTLNKVISSTSFRIGGKGVANPTAHWGDMGQTE